MKKVNFLLSTLMCSGLMLGLTGCSDDDQNVDPPKLQPKMAATYAPSTGSIPIPNDILFLGTTDLTLNIPVDDPDNASDPVVAINSLDGWSSVAPFSIEFNDYGSGLSLDPSSVVGGSSVHLFKVNVMRPEVAPGIPAPTGPVTSVQRELTAGLEYVVQATSGTSIAIIPTVPFEQQASYMVVLTNGLLDSNGSPIAPDAQYIMAQSETAIPSSSSIAALEPVRQLVNAMENAAAGDGVDKSNIILSFQFTVQSVGTVMDSAKLAYIDGPLMMGATPTTGFSALTDTTPFTGIGAANLYNGFIALPYLLGIPSLENPTAPLNTPWRALEQLPIGPDGALVPNPFGENLSYANSYPRMNGIEVAPLLVSMPKAALCAKPDTGYPVTIFLHGITRNRTDALGIADSMAAPPTCTAVVAMDQPLHGIDEEHLMHKGLQMASSGFLGVFAGYEAGGPRERTFGMDYVDNTTGAPGPDGIVDDSGKHTINLANLPVAKDNIRQAVFDILYLEKAIPFMDIDTDGTPDFDADKISFVGHSWGAVVGSSVLTHSDNIKAAVLANGGGGLAQLANASLTFGPPIRAGIAASAGMSPDDPAFGPLLNSFLFAAQTVLDAGDPVNQGSLALVNNVPTLMFQNEADSVVPNAVATAPLSGTEPLARVFDLSTLAPAEAGPVVGSRVFSKLNQGLHSSLLSPADAEGDPIGLLNVTTEMQTQMASFLATGGAAVQVVDPTLLDE